MIEPKPDSFSVQQSRLMVLRQRRRVAWVARSLLSLLLLGLLGNLIGHGWNEDDMQTFVVALIAALAAVAQFWVLWFLD